MFFIASLLKILCQVVKLSYFLVEKMSMLNKLLPFICPYDLFKDDSLGYMPHVQQVCRKQGAVEAQSPNNFENKVLHTKH